MKTFEQFIKNHYDETSWTDTIDGEDFTVTIHQLQDYLKNDPVIEIPIDEIEHISILKKTSEFPVKNVRVNAADLNFPIIITKNIDGNYHTILDGHHRLQKAINTHQKTIKAKVLDLKTCPEKYQFLFR